MKIELRAIGKRYGGNWIFRDLDLTASAGERIAITGANGSGKSTFLQLISGKITPSTGSIVYRLGDRVLSQEDIAPEVSVCGPYLELPEELTTEELFNLHFTLRKPLSLKSPGAWLNSLQLPEKREIRWMSSGMKQRIRLALAFFTESSLLILDEPCSNLDAAWSDWYRSLLQDQEICGKRVVVIGSNLESEYPGATQVIQLTNS